MQSPHQKKNRLHMLLAVLFWLAVWQFASMAIAQQLFLPSPLTVVQALARLGQTAAFWLSAANSLWRIALGFAIGLAAGVLLAWAAAVFPFVKALLRPLMLLVRATPMASFVILVLLWVGNRHISTVISFLMVLPVIYSATLTGIEAANFQLLEMAQVFRIPFWRRVQAIYLPALMPSLYSGCELALGLCWKSGVAAEVIGLPTGTIGERLFQAKIYLMTPDVFAWTAVIIVLSWLFTHLVQWLLRRFASAVEKGGSHG